MADISNPHDRFFKDLLGREDHAREFVAHYLPPDVTACLDLETLEVTKDSFVDPELREHLSDLVCRAEMTDGSDGYLYILFEHKSVPDPLVAFQLLRYVVRIWEQALRRAPLTRLPPVVPVVLYHGRAPWRVSTTFQELVAAPDALVPYLPAFRYHLCDLSTYSDEEIRGAVTLRAGLLLLKHIFSEDLTHRLPDVFRLFRDLVSQRSGLECLETLLRYVASGGREIHPGDLREALEKTLPLKGDDIMDTLAEKWIEEGLKKGIQQGIQQGHREKSRQAVLGVLEARFDVAPQSIVDILDQVTREPVLDMLLKRAVTVSSLKEFEEILRKALA